MASPWSGKIQIGDKVARVFQRHELIGGESDQLLFGKVVEMKYVIQKGSKKLQQPWWTLKFDAPCAKPLCCNSDEVLQMKEKHFTTRQQMLPLREKVGSQLTVLWYDEDKDLSLSDWEGDIRICEITKHLAAQDQFVLRFKCGYEKIVSALALLQLVADSEAMISSKKFKTKKSVLDANNEWKEYLAAMTIPVSKSKPLPSAPTGDIRETTVLSLQVQQLEIQRANVLLLERSESLATAYAIQQQREIQRFQKQKADEDAKALQLDLDRLGDKVKVTTAAVEVAALAAQEKLRKEKEDQEAAALAAQDKLRREEEEANATAARKDQEAAALAAQDKLRREEEEAKATAAQRQQDADDALRKEKEDQEAAALAAQDKLRREEEEAKATAAQRQKDADDALRKEKDEQEAASLAAQEKLRKEKEDQEAAALATQDKLRREEEEANATATQRQKDADDALGKEKEDQEAAADDAQDKLRREQEEARTVIRDMTAKDKLRREQEEAKATIETENGNFEEQNVSANYDSDGLSRKPYKFQNVKERALTDAYCSIMPWQHVQRQMEAADGSTQGGAVDPSSHPRNNFQTDFKNMIQSMVQDELKKRSKEKEVPKQPATKKRKRGGKKKHVKEEKLSDSGSDSDSSVELLRVIGANTARRVLWQRGHNTMLPSVKRAIIEAATVDSIAEAHEPLMTHGFAIISDMTEAFAPKNRCTREQRDFITKCNTTLMPAFSFMF